MANFPIGVIVDSFRIDIKILKRLPLWVFRRQVYSRRAIPILALRRSLDYKPRLKIAFSYLVAADLFIR